MRVVPDPSKRDMIGRISASSAAGGASPKQQRPRPPSDPTNRPPSQFGRRAISHVESLAFDGRLSVSQITIETGRTHQIRVHLQHRRTPVYGDDVYGLPDWNRRLRKQRGIGVEDGRPLLHAARLEIDHPVTGIRMKFVAGVAGDMAGVMDGTWPTGREERPDLFGMGGGGPMTEDEAEE